MQKIIRNSLIVGVTVFSVSLAVPLLINSLPANAEETDTTETKTTTQEKQMLEQKRKEKTQATIKEKQEVQKAAKTNKLAETKLKSCQKREKSITKTMSRLNDRGTKQIAVFTKISERTQTFYKEKGKTLSNYDALVTEVNSKKAAAEAAVANTKNTSVTFKCDGTDPKGTASSFKTSHNAQKDALKAYKTAVKNLIVGVKSVQGTKSSTEARSSEGSAQ